MRITEIYIGAFGKLKDFTLKLDDGFNVIFGENENGKTTVMAFIKAMFYGTGKKTQALNESIRQKYTPFDGSVMCGRIYYIKDEKRFCLERQFLKSDSTDKITLTNLETGEVMPETNEIGQKLFGIGAQAFSSSMFIGTDRSFSVDDTASGELNSRLSAVALTGDENTSYKKIEDKIIKAKESIISKSGRTGSLVKKQAELTALNERLSCANDDAHRKSAIVGEIEQLKLKGSTLAQRYSELKKLTDRKDDIKNAEKLKKYLSLKASLDELNKSLLSPDGTLLDSAYVSKIKFCLAKLEAQKEKCDTLKSEISDIEKLGDMSQNMSANEAKEKLSEQARILNVLKEKQSELQSKSDELKRKIQQKTAEKESAQNAKKPFNAMLLIIGAVCAAAGVAAGAVLNPLFFISAGAGLLLVLLSFILKPKDEKKAKDIESEISALNSELNIKASEISENSIKIIAQDREISILEGVINTDEAVRKHRKEELSAKREKLSEAEEKLNGLKEEYLKSSGGMSEDKLNIEKLEADAEKQKSIKSELNYLSKDLGNISYGDAEEKLKESGNTDKYKDIDFDAAEKEKEEIGTHLTELKQKITALDTELKTSFRGFEQPEILEREIALLKEKAEAEKEFADAAETAIGVLAESFLSVRQSYGGALEEKMLQNFKRLTNGSYKNATVDKSFNMRVESTQVFGMHEADYLSTGTKEQAMLALRLAVCSLISEGEAIPVMLDDALSDYDDKRTETALTFLNEFSKDNQVILFTCHNSVTAMADNHGISVKAL